MHKKPSINKQGLCHLAVNFPNTQIRSHSTCAGYSVTFKIHKPPLPSAPFVYSNLSPIHKPPLHSSSFVYSDLSPIHKPTLHSSSFVYFRLSPIHKPTFTVAHLCIPTSRRYTNIHLQHLVCVFLPSADIKRTQSTNTGKKQNGQNKTGGLPPVYSALIY